MSRRYTILLGAVVLVIAVLIFKHEASMEQAPSPYVNSVLAARGFRHAGEAAMTGESADYEVGVGEEFKVTWKMENATENGQILYHGPAGVGAGLVTVSSDATASASVAPFLTFTAKEPGTAQFSLTVTGPGPDGIYTLTSNLTVHIK